LPNLSIRNPKHEARGYVQIGRKTYKKVYHAEKRQGTLDSEITWKNINGLKKKRRWLATAAHDSRGATRR
jgi:hypothetical protein